MKIKGFDQNLCCRGMRYEIGREYKKENGDKPLKLCSDTVFHYCDSIRDVHEYYRVDANNRFCEIEVLGKEVTDGNKCGSDHIKIVREIKGKELDGLIGRENGNTGVFNSGNRNSGNCNSGDWNSGNCNSGNRNSGNRNSGNWNSGDWNSGNWNSANCNSGDWNSGNRNSGNCNSGDWNSGNCNSGDCNSGDWNSGIFNSCDYSNGVFCTEEPTIKIFNIDSGMTMSEFVASQYCKAIMSSFFPLTEWVQYAREEMENDEEKKKIGGYLKTNTYKEACAIWWENMEEEYRMIILSMPNFDGEIFKEITGIEV